MGEFRYRHYPHGSVALWKVPRRRVLDPASCDGFDGAPFHVLAPRAGTLPVGGRCGAAMGDVMLAVVSRSKWWSAAVDRSRSGGVLRCGEEGVGWL